MRFQSTEAKEVRQVRIFYGTGIGMKTQFVKDLRDKDPVHSTFLVKFSALAVGKNGKPYINLVLVDKTGEVEGRIWDNAADFANSAVRDAFVMVEGKCQLYQGRRQVVIKELRALRENDIDPKDYVEESSIDPERLYEDLLGYVASIEDPHYRALAEAILRDDESIVEKLKKAPAAKSLHHAYLSGLLEHMVSVTRILDYLGRHYHPYVSRDLLLLGGFFHDICKLWELSYERTTDYTTEGRLLGHLVMGVELVDRKIRELESEKGRLQESFPEEKKLLVKHLIVSHHGELEYGSPKRPKCLEALIVHYVDDLDSKVNAIQRFIMQDQTPGRWTQLNRQFERFFYKPDWAMKNEF